MNPIRDSSCTQGNRLLFSNLGNEKKLGNPFTSILSKIWGIFVEIMNLCLEWACPWGLIFSVLLVPCASSQPCPHSFKRIWELLSDFEIHQNLTRKIQTHTLLTIVVISKMITSLPTAGPLVLETSHSKARPRVVSRRISMNNSI